ncbi:MAG: VWA domain-containing protein [Bacteroidia bacterium]
MKLRSGKILVLVLSFTAIACLHARPAPITTEMMQAFNRYPDYLNTCVQDLWLTHKQFETFNLQLNQYYFQRFENGLGENNQVVLMTFPDELIRENSQVVRELMASSRFFVPSDQERLNARVAEIQLIFARLRAISSKLKAFSQNANSYSLDQVKSMYDLLDETSVLFEDFNIIKGNLYFELEQIYKSYQAPDRWSPWVIASGELQYLTALSHKMLDAVRVDNPQVLREVLPEMERALGRALSRQRAIMKDIEPRPESSYDPYLRYREVIIQARTIADATREFLDNPQIDSRYEILGKGYYYFNYRFVNKYSAEGQGLIHQYNRFITLSDAPLLKAVAEANIFRSIPPGALPVQFAGRNLTFLLDISGSMDRSDKLPVFRQAFVYLLEQLSPSDYVSIITYSGNANVVLPVTSVADKKEILAALHKVEVKGESKPDEGFMLAYKEAARGFLKNGDNRVVMISDGGFEISASLRKLIAENSVGKISLDAFYFGHSESVVRTRLSGLARLGNGTYAPIPAQGAPAVFSRYILGK